MAPALRDDFLFSDDYYWYDLQHSRPWDGVWEATWMTVMNGRPLHGLLFIASFPAVATPAGWVLLRALGILAMVLTAWAFAWVLRRVWDAPLADWIATALVALPGFTLFAFWLITVPCMLAATCGALAAGLALEAAWWKRALAAVLLIAGLANYQPFALVYFALLALVAVRGALPIAAYAIGVAAVGVYYLLARLCIAWMDLDMAARGAPAFLPLEKARWLVESVLPFVSTLWSMALSAPIALAALAVVLGVCCYRLRGRWRQVGPRLAFMAVASVTTILPHLSVRETVTRWRTLLPLSVVLALAVFAALGVTRWPRGVLVGVVLAILGLRAFELSRYGVGPEIALREHVERELRRVYASDTANDGTESSISAARAAPLEVSVVPARDGDSVCGVRLSDDEFTAPSAQRDFAIAGILRLASSSARVPVPVVAEGGAVVDLRRVSGCWR